jgi:hypothetical protein
MVSLAERCSLRAFLAEAGEAESMPGLKSLGLVQRQLLLESTMTDTRRKGNS